VFDRDNFFFHYTTRAAAFEHILPTQKLKFSSYAEMRDPLEAKWNFSAGGWGEFTDEQQRDQAAGYFAFSRFAQDVREQSFLLSLTVDAPPEDEESEPFCRGWARARMWEHYAEKHAGVCLVFERERLVETLATSLLAQGFSAPHHQPVIYEGDTPASPILDLAKLGQGVGPDDVVTYIEENRETLFFHKLLDWRSECEYRFSTTCYGAMELLADFGDALTAVVAGGAIPHWQRPAAIDACDAAGVQALYLDWESHGPRLVPLRNRKNRRDEIKANISKDGG
jgi:Protein of unknown function (DUF2971)